MWAYLIRRTLWTFPIVLGVVVLTFVLFTYVADDPARLRVGKQATPEKLRAERKKMGLDKPQWLNPQAARDRGIGALFDSQFFDVLLWRLPDSDHYHMPLWQLVKWKAPISASIQVPIFIVELGIQLLLALWCARYRGKWPDLTITFLAVMGMCIPVLSIIIGVQWLVGFKLDLLPVAGWSTGANVIPYMILPIVVGIAANIGVGTRFYRTVFVEEVYQDYVRTARAKGVGEPQVLLTHVFRNALIPVITNTIAHLPYLLVGSLLIERMFQIPGLGYVMVEAIQNQDRPIVLGLTYGLSVVYCLLLLVTDVLYSLADPRVRLQ